jgi:glucose/arabinose dehydrogenase
MWKRAVLTVFVAFVVAAMGGAVVALNWERITLAPGTGGGPRVVPTHSVAAATSSASVFVPLTRQAHGSAWAVTRTPDARTPTPIVPTPVPADPITLAVDFVPVADGLANPVAIASAGDGTGRLFVVEKAGRVRIVAGGVLQPLPFLDIRDRVESDATERGLLGLAFHPRYRTNGLFYVSYTTSKPARLGAGDVGAVVYARYRVSTDPDRADPDSEQVVIWWEHPRGNHNGGHLAFGPRDGYLYLGTGDGGGAGDPDTNGQDATTLLGKILRIDVDADVPYAIPTSNPYYGLSSRRNELWAIGLRNPWRFTFDRATGDLYIADVGQSTLEEIDFQPAGSPGGENYGWNEMEGTRCYEPSSGCDQTGKTLPVVEYGRDQGCSVTGGYVYRGRAFPRLFGTYFYTDWCTGRTWGLSRDGTGAWRNAEVGRTDLSIQSYGEDEDGELYVVAGDGQLLRLAETEPSGAPTPGVAAPRPNAAMPGRRPGSLISRYGPGLRAR